MTTAAAQAISFTVKPLWELTREAYFNDVARVRRDAVDYGWCGKETRITWDVKYDYVSPGPAGPFHGSTVLDYKPRKGAAIAASFGQAVVKSAAATQTRISEKFTLDLEQLLAAGKAIHRQAVLDAIDLGYTISEDVLQDYPELRPDEYTSAPAPR